MSKKRTKKTVRDVQAQQALLMCEVLTAFDIPNKQAVLDRYTQRRGMNFLDLCRCIGRYIGHSEGDGDAATVTAPKPSPQTNGGAEALSDILWHVLGAYRDIREEQKKYTETA